MSIDNVIISRTAGGNDDYSQTFIQNYINSINPQSVLPFEFDLPSYQLIGATFNFFEHDFTSLSINVNNQKSIIFNYSANTVPLNNIQLVNDIYRIEYNDYTAFTQSHDISTILNNLQTPIVTISESAITLDSSSQFTVNLPVVIKPTNKFSINLLTDKSQYFIDSKYLFNKNTGATIGDFQVLSSITTASTINYIKTGLTSANTLTSTTISVLTSTTFIEQISVNSSNSTLDIFNTSVISDGIRTPITGGTLSGYSVPGAFFTYFTLPNKPNLNIIGGTTPSVIGDLNTFSPTFNFNSVNDGDYYRLQVSYDITDTTFSSSALTNFIISQQAGDAEFIRTYAIALSPNSAFIYRIGNTKELTNIFNVKQNVTMWSDYYQAYTANDGTFALAGHVYKNVLSGTPIAGAQLTITGIRTISVVDLGIDSSAVSDLAAEATQGFNSSLSSNATVFSDSTGFYNFGRLNGGDYIITAEYATNPSYRPYSAMITLNKDLFEYDIVLSIVWGDTNITFDINPQEYFD